MLMKSVDCLMVVSDMKGEIVDVNEAVASFLGYASKDMLGRNVSMMMPR